MASLSAHARYIAEKLSEVASIDIHVVEAAVHDALPQINAFMGADGPLKLIFFYQIPEIATEAGEFMTAGSKPKLFLTSGERERCRGKCFYFVRIGSTVKPLDIKNADTDIAYGEVSSSVLDSFQTVLKNIFTTAMANQDWGKAQPDEQSEFESSLEKFNSILSEAAMSLQGGIELRKPDLPGDIENKQSAYIRAAMESDTVLKCEAIIQEWCNQTESLLAETESTRKEPDDAGPDTELVFWRNRMAKFNGVAEQLKSKEARFVLGVAQTAKSQRFKQWKAIDNAITDALNEAKDNVKYLATLEKYTDPLFHGSPEHIIEALPGLMNNVKMMLTIARYYSTRERMTCLFRKITNQMITNCKNAISSRGRLWDQPPDLLIENLRWSLRLNDAYQEQYRLTREKLATQPKVKQFDFNEQEVFGKFDLFCKRLSKLIDLFTTIQQFSALANREIEGMDNLIRSFAAIVEDFKRKPYDLLDYTRNTFDRDFLEFNVNVAELETALQGFINASFENITSTEHALNLLRQFEAILQRDTLKSDLDSKYVVIFHNYGLDLETVQKIYDKQKLAPPTTRNAPPVAGNIQWSRHLLRRIEGPMHKFKNNKSIMITKESKKIIRTYNKVARALIEYETLWHHAWCKSIEAAKSGLQATLIIRHPRSGMLFVNFDREILQLIREAKHLQRMGIEIPESARMVLLQEGKFKFYFDQLTFALQEYERVLGKVPPVIKPIIKPHLEDLDRKVQPGMVLLTWQSMNIDSYLFRLHNGISRLEELISKINDIMDNRIEVNLKAISRTVLVDLPQHQSFTLDGFVALQEKSIRTKSKLMDHRNLQVERAVDDLVDTIVRFPLESPDLQCDLNEVNKLRSHYERLMYTAVLHATKQSFWALKNRLGSRQGNSNILIMQRPFFEVEVELSVPNLQMNPSLEEVQATVNKTALHIVQSTKKVYIWGQDRDNVKTLQSFHRQISQDKEIVKIVMLLTGAVEGAKTHVADYLSTFGEFDYLWRDDKQKAYQEFLRTDPDIEAFSGELRKYMDVERQIRGIPSVHVIGCMCLDSSPLMDSLIAEAVQWKTQYARNLHDGAREKLHQMQDFFKEKMRQMSRDFKELEDVRDVMNCLKEIREREPEIEKEIVPIQDRYNLLSLYEHEVPPEETEELHDLQQSWAKLKKRAFEVSDRLRVLQTPFRTKLLENVVEFIEEVKEFRKDFELNGPMRPGMSPMDANEALKKYQRYFEKYERNWNTYSEGEEMFALYVTEYPELEQTKKELGLLEKLYSLYTETTTTINGYADILWTDVVANIEGMNEEVGKLQTRCKTMPKALRDWDAYNELKRKIDDFLEVLPLLTALSGKAMQDRHWKQIQEITGSKLDMNPETFKLAALLDIGNKPGETSLLKVSEEVEDICGGSIKELQIETKLKALVEQWSELKFSFNNFKNRGPVILSPKELSEIMEALEESQMTLGSMASNRYSAPFREQIQEWLANLSTVNDVVEQWVGVQNLWIYMEAVFSSGDIAKQLPQEAKRFSGIDKNFMKVTSKANENPQCVECCCQNEVMKELLPHLMEQLELCQKSLTGYLETKKNSFPRFYFCSDSVLLEILSQGSDPHAIVQHLQNVFDSLAAVSFDKQKRNTMITMVANDSEEVRFLNPLDAKGNVEDYLGELVGTMQSTIKDLCRDCGGEAGTLTCAEVIRKYPAQICILALQFDWTTRTTEALKVAKQDKTALLQAYKKEDSVLKELIAMTVTDLTPLNRTNVETLITIDVHQVDISNGLHRDKIKEPTDFEWMKQARFYWNYEQDACVISICDVDFTYNDEYLGCKERLVITPLTDRCYITLSQAIGMFLGGAPAGPAGTGKTETTKDMGRTLGIFVVVFNCSDQMDYKALGKIYKGLAMAGCWGCFDEFNRIDLDVLSVAAQQVASVLQAQRERRNEFVFTDGQTVYLRPGCSYFITMNPGYAGRQELPENLKSLFRGVCMMVPDFGLIMRVKLASCGFFENALIAKKFDILYKLCKEQLSKQTHYDYGLRNILSVLRTAGKVKRQNLQADEYFLMMRTLRDMNLSKLVAEDEPLFISLINDLFPGITAAKATFPNIEEAMANQCKELNLQYENAKDWAGKCVQLLETYYVRHGIGIVGPTGSGKTCMQEVLSRALSVVDVKHVLLRMNPKAITAPQMFGRMDQTTGDWTDGVFAVLWRKGTKSKTQNTWIVLDGPVDAIWIENLNTVLDDNKLLTLANGDRIPMSPAMKCVFEPENLINASPATVSRMGIIYVSGTVLGWQPLVPSWLFTRTHDKVGREKEKELLQSFITKYVEDMLDCVTKKCKAVMYSTDGIYVSSCFKILEEMLMPSVQNKVVLSDGEMERTFLYALCWSLGALLELEDRRKFNDALAALAGPMMPDLGADTLFEFFVDEQGQWKHWRERVVSWVYPTERDPSFAELLIPTLDSIRYEAQLRMLVPAQKPVLLTGAPGVAKTATIMQYIAALSTDEWLKKTVPFSFVTTAEIFQKTLESCVEKRQGRTFGPPGNKKCSFFIDDISMPVINAWGDQVTNEIVRQCLDEKGCYSLDKPGEMKFFADMGYMGAMVHPGGGRNDIPNRLKRQFCLFNVTMPSFVAIENIFGSIMTGRLSTSSPFHAVPKVVAEHVVKLTEATIQLWQKTSVKMLPTPAKFHYSWNMREISRVFGGMFMASRQTIRDEVYLLQLWRHECERVFTDKLTNQVDKDWESAAILNVIDAVYGKQLAARVAGPLYFVNFMPEPLFDDEGVCLDERPKSYELVDDIDKVREKALNFQTQYNEVNKVGKLELVLFEYALEHLMRISRCINQDRGSMMLVGVGGSGKQSISRLASFIAGNVIFQITITKYYGLNNLFEDIKNLYKTSGLKGQPVTFIFTDAEVKDEAFLEYINQILSTGEVSGVFAKDELDAIVSDMRPIAKKQYKGFVDTTDNLQKFFYDRVRNMLHVVLCMSPVGDKLASRSRKFPGLINCTTVDWFLMWPEEGLLDVSRKYISGFTMETTPEHKKNLMAHMSKVHSMVQKATGEYFQSYRRNVYVTPKSYLSFLKTYCTVYADQFGRIKQLANNINLGLEKMTEAAVDVEKMKVELSATEKILQEAAQKSAVLLKEITVGTAAAEKTKAEVKVVADAAGEKATVIGGEKAEVEKDLEAAKPALIEAESALNAIKPNDMKDLKALKNPPDVVKIIFDGLILLKREPMPKCQMMEVKGIMCYKDNYASGSKLMNDTNAFLVSLQQFPKENITDEDCELLSPYVDHPLFTVEFAAKASAVAVGLCKWVKAMKTYHEIAKVVIPKMDALRVKEAELAAANKKLAQAQAQLAAAQASLDEMQEKFDKAMADKQKLQDDADNTKRKMDAANALISGLSGEKVRWTQQSKEFDDQIDRLVGDCAIACAFMSYLGPFNKNFRDRLMQRDFMQDILERKMPVTKNLDVSAMLTDSATTGEWNLQGLPTDDLSIQNGILTTRASRFPIMVDPQGQGLAWIRNKEASNGVKETSFQDKAFRNSLEDCMGFGKPLLLANVENELDPVLDPVLDKAFIKKGKNFIVQLADKECDVEPDKFLLYITTRLPNPHFTPELSARVTVIDFTVTIQGLEDQLLARVVLQEKPELEQERRKLQADVNQNQKLIVELQDLLLDKLSSCEGSLLDDPDIVEVLANTKKRSKEVQEILKNAAEAETRIKSACEEFRPVATRGSILYFLIAEMSGINVMYQTSLAQFIQIFSKSMLDAEENKIPAKRIRNIIEELSYATFLYIGRGLFERHKDVFIILLAMKVQIQAQTISMDHFNCFVKGGAALDVNAVRKKPGNWITDNNWLNAVQLSMSIPLLKELPEAIVRGDQQWKQWNDLEAPEQQRVPDFEDKLDKMHRMLIIRALRPDRTMIVAKEYVADALGQKYVVSNPLNLETTHAESNERTPFVCVLSMGSDPTDLILGLAKKKKKEVQSVSMGQGQEVVARRFCDQGVATGCWVLLQNCHLGIKFLIELEQRLAAKDAEVIDPEFRVWITSEPHPQFPIGLLQMSIKITNEAPVGMKAGMKRSYAWVTQDMLDIVARAEWKTLVWVMCHAHSVVQERRKFGSIGWTVPYEFNQSDLNACCLFLQKHLLEMEAKKSKEVTWTTVRYMVSEIQYGGRITDDWDRRQMNYFSDKFFTQAVFDPGYEFLKGYSIPAPGDINAYRRHIDDLMPAVDVPEVVGLNQNADLTYRLQQATDLFDTILETQPRGGGGGGKSREDIVTEMCVDLLSKVPADFNKLEQQAALQKMGATKPIIIAFRQEMDVLQKSISVVRSTLKNLQMAIAGTIVMSDDLANALDAMFNAKVPAMWLKGAWFSPTVGIWFQILLSRHEQFDRWLKQGRPKSYWLPGFSNGQGFLTAMKQEVARSKQGWALDDVVMFTEVVKMDSEDVKESPQDGIYVHGLYLEGASWSKKEAHLVEAARGELVKLLPVMYITGVLKSNKKMDYQVYECPVYFRFDPRKRGMTAAQPNFMFAPEIKTVDPPAKWVLRGVALLTYPGD